jgi:hypothetical protein
MADGDKCGGSKCLPGVGCSPVIKMQQDFSTFIKTATQGMEDHQKISNMVWDNTKTEIAELIDNTKECFANMNDAALKMNEGANVMSILRKDIDSVASYSRDSKLEMAEELKAACDLKETELLWLRRGIYVSLCGHAITMLFLVASHPKFILVLSNLMGMG